VTNEFDICGRAPCKENPEGFLSGIIPSKLSSDGTKKFTIFSIVKCDVI
jgi:hypothetical protein